MTIERKRDLDRVVFGTPDDSWSDNRASIGPAPYLDASPEWPTYGYDGTMDVTDYSGDRDAPRYTRTEWLTLAHTMRERWHLWAEWVANAPSELFKEN